MHKHPLCVSPVFCRTVLDPRNAATRRSWAAAAASGSASGCGTSRSHREQVLLLTLSAAAIWSEVAPLATQLDGLLAKLVLGFGRCRASGNPVPARNAFARSSPMPSSAWTSRRDLTTALISRALPELALLLLRAVSAHGGSNPSRRLDPPDVVLPATSDKSSAPRWRRSAAAGGGEGLGPRGKAVPPLGRTGTKPPLRDYPGRVDRSTADVVGSTRSSRAPPPA